jgi:hypothetical protein
MVARIGMYALGALGGYLCGESISLVAFVAGIILGSTLSLIVCVQHLTTWRDICNSE